MGETSTGIKNNESEQLETAARHRPRARLTGNEKVLYAYLASNPRAASAPNTQEMAEMCGVAKGNLVLDLGVGRGVTPCYLAEKYGCDIIGVDISERMLQRAERVTEEKGLTDKVSLRKADAHNLPFEDGSFDVVIVECVTTLLDKPKAFSEMYRVLKSGGSLGDLEMTWQKKPCAYM